MLTGYVQLYDNSTCKFGVGTASLNPNLDYIVVGGQPGASTAPQKDYSMLSQAAVQATAGTTYTFYASASRWDSNDAATMGLNSVKMTAEFAATQ